MLFDIAITINDFCTEYPAAHLNSDKVDAYLEAYQKVRALTSDELECLDVFLAMAACRFGQCVCKLLKNKEEGRTGDDILQKTRKKCEQ